MNTSDSTRVEVTPELLMQIEEAAGKAKGLPWHLGDYRGFGSEAEGEYDVNANEGWELTGNRGTFSHRANAELCILLANSASALVGRIRELESALEGATTYVCPHGTAPSRVCALCNPEPTNYAQGHPFTAADIFVAYVTGASEASQSAGPVTADLLNRAGDAYVKSVNPLASDTSS